MGERFERQTLEWLGSSGRILVKVSNNSLGHLLPCYVNWST